jgi:hypothetical protein
MLWHSKQCVGQNATISAFCLFPQAFTLFVFQGLMLISINYVIFHPFTANVFHLSVKCYYTMQNNTIVPTFRMNVFHLSTW